MARSPQLIASVLVPVCLHVVASTLLRLPLCAQAVAAGPPVERSVDADRPEVHRQPNAGGARRRIDGPMHNRVVQLGRIEVSQIESLLRPVIGGRLRPFHGQTAPAYQVLGKQGGQATMLMDSPRNRVSLSGPQPLVRQVSLLVQSLDQSPPAAARRVDGSLPKTTIRAVPMGRVSPAALQTVAAALAGPADSQDDEHPNSKAPGTPQDPSRLQDTPPPTDPQPKDDAPARQLAGDIEYELLPDLDAIILRGSEADVQQLLRIIQQIEKISSENAPVIQIVALQHVASQSLATLIDQVLGDAQGVLAGRQGRVTITPLIKPNAILLIGWGETLTFTAQLIEKLDTPVTARSQLRVFRLRHAPAEAAKATLDEFYAARSGLGPTMVVSADARSNSLIVQASPRDMEELAETIRGLDTPSSAAVSQVRILRLKNSLAPELAETLQGAIRAASGADRPANQQKSAILELLAVDAAGERMLKSGILADVIITPDPPKNALIVTAPAESMELVAELIRKLDEFPAAVAQIKVFRIMNASAASLADVLRALLPEKTGGAPSPQLAGAEGESSLAPLRLSVDGRTNSIIATGAAGDLNIIQALLLKLDEDGVRQRETTVYRLKNAPAFEVSEAVNEFLQSRQLVREAAPGDPAPTDLYESEVVVVPEEVSNSLMISAPPRLYEDIMDLVEQLDAQPDQVMIQVLIAEVGLDNTDEFGVELGIQDSLLFDRSLLENLITTTRTVQQSTADGIITNTEELVQSATIMPGFAFNNQMLGNSGSTNSLATSGNVGGQALSNFSVGRINNELGFGGLVLSASSESISVLIRALSASRRVEVLSRPQVMTLDNQPAFIQVGQRVPRIVGTSVSEVGQVNTVTLENVGLILGVTPRISPTGMVVMEIDAEKSELGLEQEGIPVSISATGEVIRAPRINTTTAQTTVSAASGETIVLGGLITNNDATLRRRVPYLSDIPILGILFRYDGQFTERTELLIIMTPHVIRSSEEAQQLRHVEEARISWSAGDVQQMHGQGGICRSENCPYCENDTPVIYPDLNPRGTLPAGPQLEPEPIEPLGSLVQPTSFDSASGAENRVTRLPATAHDE